MLTVKQPSSARKINPNLLPCSIKHDGPIDIDERYWKPVDEPDGSSVVYFRGRKLCGKTLKLPNGYQGMLLEKTDERLIRRPNLPIPQSENDELGDIDLANEETSIETKIMEQNASFDSITVWGHESLPQDDEPHVKGMNEWLAFAQAMHSYDDAEPKT